MRNLLAACVLAVGFAACALPCSCFHGGCPGLGEKQSPVFVGTVLSVSDVPYAPGEAPFLSTRRARFQIDDSFGGIAAETREIDIYTGSGGGDCGIRFTPGERYLVTPHLGKDGLLRTGICSFTMPVSEAVSSLQLLKQLRAGRPSPSLTGRIALQNRNFEGHLGTAAPRPLASTKVRVTAGGRTWETLSDAEGVYAFYGLPAGKYQLDPVLPPGTRLSWYIGSDEPPRAVDVMASACWTHDIDVFSSGSIQGRVLDSSNRPLPDATVYLIPVGTSVSLANKQDSYSASQNEKDGFFRFVHLDPGQYQILVNPEDVRNPAFPYPRTFYPGVREAAAAGVITVGPGEQVKDADIRLQPLFRPRTLAVRVTWADGRLIRDYVHVEAKGLRVPETEAQVRWTDRRNSIFELSLMPDEPYRIRAELVCYYSHASGMGPGEKLQTVPVDLGAKDERNEITLTLLSNACPVVPGKTLMTEKE